MTVVELIDTAHEKSQRSPEPYKFRNIFATVTERYQHIPKGAKRSGTVTVLYGKANGDVKVGDFEVDANGIVTKFEPDSTAPYYAVKPFIDALT